MELSWDAVLLGMFVVVPGFAYFGVTSIFAPTEKEKTSDFEALARSIAVSGLLLAAEAIVVMAVSIVWHSLEHEIDDIANSGLNDYFKKHTREAIAIAAAVSILNTVVLAALAWFELV